MSSIGTIQRCWIFSYRKLGHASTMASPHFHITAYGSMPVGNSKWKKGQETPFLWTIVAHPSTLAQSPFCIPSSTALRNLARAKLTRFLELKLEPRPEKPPKNYVCRANGIALQPGSRPTTPPTLAQLPVTRLSSRTRRFSAHFTYECSPVLMDNCSYPDGFT